MSSRRTNTSDGFNATAKSKEEALMSTVDVVANRDRSNNIQVAAPSCLALKNANPCNLITIFEPSKIRNFLYKVEPSMAKINASSLELISTTAALVLESLVEKVMIQEQDVVSYNRACRKTCEDEDQRGQNLRDFDQGAIQGDAIQQFLITSNHLKKVVSSNTSSSFDFFDQVFENLRDKDGSALPSKLTEYVPRKISNKNHRTHKRAAASSTAVSETETTSKRSNRCEVNTQENNDSNNKRPKNNHPGKNSSFFCLPERSNDANCLEKIIMNAASAPENLALNKIVEDEDDYD